MIADRKAGISKSGLGSDFIKRVHPQPDAIICLKQRQHKARTSRRQPLNVAFNINIISDAMPPQAGAGRQQNDTWISTFFIVIWMAQRAYIQLVPEWFVYLPIPP
jgi:hypothetical protein